MEKNGGVTFDDAQVALARLWLGPSEKQQEYKVKIKSVAPKQANINEMGQTAKQDENGAEFPCILQGMLTVHILDLIKEIRVPPTVEEAESIIARFQSGAPRGDKDVSDTVNSHVQLDSTDLRREKWLGTRNEERNR